MRLLLAAAAAALAALAPAPAAAQSRAPDYASEKDWLCLPGRDDICSRALAVTPLGPKGYGKTVAARPADNPPVDCFYVYPTISQDPGLNSDLNPGSAEELFVTQYQFARLSGVCRPFVPLYRQMTMSSIAVAATGGDVMDAGMLAFGDVARAWATYLEKYNEGRPFVLVGHSQGSIMLEQLLKTVIEKSPAKDRMVRAILPGWNFPVKPGEARAEGFASTPLCRDADDTGCMMSWTTYGEGERPVNGAFFGTSKLPGTTNACTHPAQPGAKGWAPLDGFFYAKSSYPVPGGPVRWAKNGSPPTGYISTEKFLEARCVQDGQAGYLEIRLPRAPGDMRTARIGGEVGQFGIFLPGWGKHLADIAIAQGSIIDSIARLGATVTPARTALRAAPQAQQPSAGTTR
ncbi:DUF3089 domain-containing protein [Sphingomicrobium nitratireducens]|uniref:DUF3089 domain-containing protein n=1 Tax=Sphingomicrobium nitratireducens TaxID=2964666 RepID=UPI00223F16E7|nr:DUF3089 domain-containing protein [Sphingomicrobium nitratireducens]